jgi:hypothetical protein
MMANGSFHISKIKFPNYCYIKESLVQTFGIFWHFIIYVFDIVRGNICVSKLLILLSAALIDCD